MEFLEHDLMGRLERSGIATTCDWTGRVTLPSFAECYEKWSSDGTEFPFDRRSEEHRRGVFDLTVLSGVPFAGFGGRRKDAKPVAPSAPQCAAFSVLVDRHAVLVKNLQAALNAYVRGRDRGWSMLEDDEFERLLQPEMILGTLSLESVCITYHTRGASSLVGLYFHSEIWDDEHGIGAVVHEDRVLHLGAAVDAFPESMGPDQ